MSFYTYFTPTQLPPEIDTDAIPREIKDRIGICGRGDEYQGNIQTSHNPSFQLLTTAPAGALDHMPELAKLVRKVNRYFERRARRLILKKRAHANQPDLEIGIEFTDDGLKLVYAHALPGKEAAPTPRRPGARPSVSGGGSVAARVPKTGTVLKTGGKVRAG